MFSGIRVDATSGKSTLYQLFNGFAPNRCSSLP
jgi:hypothetical protein